MHWQRDWPWFPCSTLCAAVLLACGPRPPAPTRPLAAERPAYAGGQRAVAAGRPAADPERPSPRRQPLGAAGAINISAAAVVVPEPEVDEPFDNPLQELARLGEAAAGDSAAAPEGGGSIRAKRDADLVRSARLNDPRNARARVEEIARGSFPLVALRVQIVEPAGEGAGASVARGDRVVVLPQIHFDEARRWSRDEATEINIGCYYLQRGDKIAVRPATRENGRWTAEYVERF